MIPTYIIIGWFVLVATIFPHPAAAGVVAFDDVTTPGRELILKTLTKGRLLPAGGMRWTLFVDDLRVGKGLTGGDGYGYMKFTPETAGFKSIRVESGGESATSHLLVVGKKSKVIVIDLDPLLRGALKQDQRGKGARDALNSLDEAFALIYIAGTWEMFAARKWLAAQEFPEAVVSKNEGPGLFARFKERGVNLFGLVGKRSLVIDAADYFQVALTFEGEDAETLVSDWEEVLERMRN
jgi:hypothetical protein